MLQRAASNAYSWWWASHIRTKQSKWLEQSLQDMEEKVQYVLRLIQEDGDSFAKRAEMYYKKRPELINFVEEFYRAYRALSERYDHLSTELQNANNTIASVFPERVQLEMDEDDEYGSRIPKRHPQVPVANGTTVPKVPKAPIRDWKGLITASKKMQAKKNFAEEVGNKTSPKSGLSKTEAIEEIDKLQKDILALQTVKEFVKSSYESGLSRYWEIEKQIMEMQEKICSLQDEFAVVKVIEDDEARTLMAEAALKSCQETLAQLQEKQERSNQEAKEEYKKIEDACQKLKSIRREFLHDRTDDEKIANEKDELLRTGKTQSSNKDVGHVTNESHDAEVTQEKTRENFEVGPLASLTVTELAEKMDELVNKVISLETSVSSQTVLINRLRTETDDLHVQIKALEDDKANLTDETQNLTSRVESMEEKLKGIQDLNRNVENQNSNLQIHFAEAHFSIDHLSEKLSNVKPDEELEVISSLADEDRLHVEKIENRDEPGHSLGKEETSALRKEDVRDIKRDSGESISGPGADGKQAGEKTVQFQDPVTKEMLEEHEYTSAGDSLPKTELEEIKTEGEFDWQHMLLSGCDDKEKILLTEYTTILRNYKEAKKKMSEMEKKDGDREFEVTVQMRELKNAIAKRDEEIHRLRQKLTALEGKLDQEKDVEEENGASSDDRSVNPESQTEVIRIHEMEEEEDDIKLILSTQPGNITEVEEKLRLEIDAILDENLDFWLRFCTTFHKIQKFKTTVQDLEDEILKLHEKKKQEGSITAEMKSDVRPIYKHLREIQTELTVWLEQSVVLKDEMERRFSSLCNIQEKITVALKEGVEEEKILFSSHQAAKFQGEILNMKQENNKVREELEAGVDHVTSLRLEIDKTLRKLNEEFELSGDHSSLRHSTSRTRVPLRSFIFGTKQRKQRHSLFSSMHTNRKYQILRAGVPQ